MLMETAITTEAFKASAPRRSSIVVGKVMDGFESLQNELTKKPLRRKPPPPKMAVSGKDNPFRRTPFEYENVQGKSHVLVHNDSLWTDFKAELDASGVKTAVGTKMILLKFLKQRIPGDEAAVRSALGLLLDKKASRDRPEARRTIPDLGGEISNKKSQSLLSLSGTNAFQYRRRRPTMSATSSQNAAWDDSFSSLSGFAEMPGKVMANIYNDEQSVSSEYSACSAPLPRTNNTFSHTNNVSKGRSKRRSLKESMARVVATVASSLDFDDMASYDETGNEDDSTDVSDGSFCYEMDDLSAQGSANQRQDTEYDHLSISAVNASREVSAQRRCSSASTSVGSNGHLSTAGMIITEEDSDDDSDYYSSDDENEMILDFPQRNF